MSSTARSLQLLSLLQAHRWWSGDDLARRLEVSVRTLRRDVDRLRELGYPVEADRGVGGGYQLAAGASLPPLVVDNEEAVALAVGLQLAAQSSLSGLAEASVRALTKVTQVMPKSLRRRVEAVQHSTVNAGASWAAPPIDPDTMVTLAQACRDREGIEFDYETRDGDSALRRIEPAQLVTVGQRWYAVAYDLDRRDWRTFRLDRMEQPTSTGRTFLPRAIPGGDAAAYVKQGMNTPSGDIVATAVLRADREDVESRIGRWSEVTDSETHGCCKVRIVGTTTAWVMIALGLAEAEVVSVEEPEIAELCTAWASRFAGVAPQS